MLNPYEVLQLSPLADADVIRAAYRSLIQRHHPDRNPGDERAAQMTVQITQAYELLSDPERKMAFDVQLNTSIQAPIQAPTQTSTRANDFFVPSTQRGTRKNQPAQHTSKKLTWVLYGLALLVGAALVWTGMRAWLPGAASGSPAQQLSAIRAQIENAQTSEAERRKLYFAKEELLLQHADLLLADSALKVDYLAARSVALNADPITFTLGPKPGTDNPALRLQVPEITLVLGSFDAPLLLDQIAKHQARIVQELKQRAEAQPIAWAPGADFDVRLKLMIRQSVMLSLDLRSEDVYPSTYFESPGRHGVVEAIFPKSYLVIK